MRLRNKKTGEIARFRSIPKGNDKSITLLVEDTKKVYQYDTFTRLANEWEDEEPKEIWTITTFGEVQGGNLEEDIIPVDPRLIDKLKSISNYFETREEAEKAVEKLKAWKRLKDKGFKLTGWEKQDKGTSVYYDIKITAHFDSIFGVSDDFNLLFGGEDE